MLEGSLRIRGRVVGSFGNPGFPRRVTGALSRSVRSFAEKTEFGARGVVGIEHTVRYARILELGGTQPARDIYPRRRRFLRWTTGMTHRAGEAAMDFGLTSKQAHGAPRTRRGRAKERPDTVFVGKKGVHQPARYQRPIPFLGPAFEGERPEIERTLRSRIAAALR
jgi:hypothetical protein